MDCKLRDGSKTKITWKFVNSGCSTSPVTSVSTVKPSLAAKSRPASCATKPGAWLAAVTICYIATKVPIQRTIHFGIARLRCVASNTASAAPGQVSGTSSLRAITTVSAQGKLSARAGIIMRSLATITASAKAQHVANSQLTARSTVTSSGLLKHLGNAVLAVRANMVAGYTYHANAMALLHIQVSTTAAGVIAPPAAPSNLIATPSAGLVTLTWNVSPRATSYNINRGTWSGAETSLVTGVGTTNYTDNSAFNGTTYFYTVDAVNVGGSSTDSNEVAATPGGANFVLDHFTDTNGTNLTAHTMDAGKGWQIISGQFTVQSNRAVSQATNALYVTDSGQADGTISTVVNLTTGPMRLIFRFQDVNNYWFTQVQSNTFYLFVVFNGSPVFVGQQNISLAGGDHTISCTLSGGSISVTLDGSSLITTTDSRLQAATKIGIYGSTGDIFDDITFATTSAAIPTTPVAAPLDSYAQLSWDTQAGVAFNIYEGTSSGAEGTIPIAANFMGNTYYRGGLINGTSYFWKIKAVAGAGETAASSEVSTTPAVYASPLLTNLAGYWEGNEATAATRNDATANADNLTNHNSAAQVAGINAGEFATSFNGTTQFLDHVDAAALKLGAAQSFTLASWVKATATGVPQILISKDDASNNREYRLWLIDSFGTAHQPQIDIWDGSNTNNSIRWPTAIDFSTKFHLICVYYDAPSGTFGMRIDTSNPVEATISTTATNASTASFTLGVLNEGGASDFLKASMCKTALWKRKLNNQDYINLYARDHGNNATFSQRRLWRKWNNDTDPQVLKVSTGAQALFEPRPWKISNTSWKMVYSRMIDGSNITMNVTTSRDGINWDGLGYPVLGQGIGGESSIRCARGGIYVEGGNVYLSYADFNHNISLAQSTDGGLTFNRIAQGIITDSMVSGTVANSQIFKDGATYVISFDWFNNGLGIYRTGIATASSISGPYTVILADASTLAPGITSSRAQIIKDVNGLWHAFTWPAKTNMSSYPDYFKHFTNTDYTLDNWVVANGGTPFVDQTEQPLDWGATLVDQIADVGIVDDGTNARAYYSLNHQSPYRASIAMAIYPGTMAQMLADEIA